MRNLDFFNRALATAGFEHLRSIIDWEMLMNRIRLAFFLGLVAIGAGSASAQGDVFSQPVLGFIPKPGWPPAGPVPRLADGKPDLSGPWAPNALRINNTLLPKSRTF